MRVIPRLLARFPPARIRSRAAALSSGVISVAKRSSKRSNCNENVSCLARERRARRWDETVQFRLKLNERLGIHGLEPFAILRGVQLRRRRDCKIEREKHPFYKSIIFHKNLDSFRLTPPDILARFIITKGQVLGVRRGKIHCGLFGFRRFLHNHRIGNELRK
jgi:hypothetical protein